MRRYLAAILAISALILASLFMKGKDKIAESAGAQENPSPAFVSAPQIEETIESASPYKEGTAVDIEGNIYRTVQIDAQVWMAENLRTTRFCDGQPIKNVIGNQQWGKLSSPANCWLNDEEANKDIYGALYNWYSVNTQLLAPEGWHIPADEEWITLISYLGGENIAGGKLKEAGTQHWLSPNTGTTDEFGFSARFGGNRNFEGLQYNEPDACYFRHQRRPTQQLS